MHTVYGANQYRKTDVEGASPIRLVVMAYDLAILSCDRKDLEKASQAVNGLQNALDFDYPEAAGGLLAIYHWVMDCLRKGDFESARKTLLELREAWATIEKRLNTSNRVQVTENGGLLYDNEIENNKPVQSAV